MISVENVVKTFGETKALDGLSFSVKKGEVLGLLGPNGAGKTTIVRILSTLLDVNSGTVKVDGINVRENPGLVREIIGFAGQFAAVDELLTGRQNLEMVGKLYHLQKQEIKKRMEEVLEQIDLVDVADKPVKTYSGGMRRRLDLGASLMHTPKVLFLDEPTTGLDPKTRRDIWEYIQKMVDNGVTLLLTTQYLEEADELADKIVVIDHGKVIAEGSSAELKKQLRGDVLEIFINNEEQLNQASNALSKVFKEKIEIDEGLCQLRFPVSKGVEDLEKSLHELKDAGIEVVHVNLSQPTLDDVFLELTKKKEGN